MPVVANKLPFLPTVRPMKKCRAEKQIMPQDLPWEDCAAFPGYLNS